MQYLNVYGLSIRFKAVVSRCVSPGRELCRARGGEPPRAQEHGPWLERGAGTLSARERGRAVRGPSPPPTGAPIHLRSFSLFSLLLLAFFFAINHWRFGKKKSALFEISSLGSFQLAASPPLLSPSPSPSTKLISPQAMCGCAAWQA